MSNTSSRLATWFNTAMLCVAATFCFAGAQALAGQVSYGVTDLGTLGGSTSVGYGINSSGAVTGYAYLASNTVADAFIWNPTSPNSDSGSIADLGSLGGAGSAGYAVNTAGAVCGYAYTASSVSNAFEGTTSGLSDIGTLTGGSSSQATSIDTSGLVTGYSGFSSFGDHAFLYNGSQLTDLGTLGGTSSYGYGINDAGAVAGASDISGNGAEHAFLYSNSQMTDLGVLDTGVNSYAYAINTTGNVAGATEVDTNGDEHAFLYSSGTMADLGTLGGSNSQAYALDDNNDVVGSSYLAGNVTAHAFVCTAGTMTDLNSLIDTNSGWVLQSANGINATGQIVGTGLIGGNIHAFLLTPATITQPPNPVPVLSVISPRLVDAGANTFTLTLGGRGFVQTSQVYWNQTLLSSTYTAAEKLNAVVPSSLVAVAGTAKLSVVNPAPGGGTSLFITVVIGNPAPSITSLAPGSALAGGPTFILQVNGSAMVHGANVTWNGSPIATTWVSANEVTASVSVNQIASVGSANVAVSNPGPGGGLSNVISLPIESPAPNISTVSPPTVNASSQGVNIIVQGSGFLPNAVVNWNAGALLTTYVDSTKLKAEVPASLLSTPGSIPVVVTNPSPSQGVSNAITVKILPTTVTLLGASLSRDADTGVITAVLSFQNTGHETATNFTITKVLADTTHTTSTLPLVVGNIAPKATATATVTFPGSAGTTGEQGHISVEGTYGPNNSVNFLGTTKITYP